MGAALRVPYVRLEPWTEGLAQFRQRGFSLVALTPREDGVPVSQAALKLEAADRLILLVGAEGPGLDDATTALADVRVRIPITPIVDSLNVVVAAGIALERLCGSAAVSAAAKASPPRT
jgi:tRNA G18 (ribose-2'-O)-methylase SpoU